MKKSFKGIGITAVLLVSVLGLGLLAVPFLQSSVAEARPASQDESGPIRTITVLGEGTVNAQPDIAQINIGVENVNEDVQLASSEAATTMENLLTALEGQGVANSDIETSYFNVWVERPYGLDGLPSTEVLYHVNNNIIVTVRDLDNLSTTLAAAIEAGATNINGVDFRISNPDQLQADAKRLAAENALASANELADLHSVTVGQVVTISEILGGGAPIPFDGYGFAETAGGGGIGPISPGNVEVRVQLQVTYEIQ